MDEIVNRAKELRSLMFSAHKQEADKILLAVKEGRADLGDLFDLAHLNQLYDIYQYETHKQLTRRGTRSA